MLTNRFKVFWILIEIFGWIRIWIQGSETLHLTLFSSHLFAGHGYVLLAGVGIVLVRVEHDDRVGQRVGRISIRQALIITAAVSHLSNILILRYHFLETVIYLLPPSERLPTVCSSPSLP